MAEDAAELIVRDDADKGGAGAHLPGNGGGIGDRPAAGLHRGRHDGVKAVGLAGVDQFHRTLDHLLLAEKGFIDFSQNIDDGIADGENVIAGGGHALSH